VLRCSASVLQIDCRTNTDIIVKTDKIQSIKLDCNSYISFKIDNETFAMHVAHVNNIVEIPRITRIPNSPDYILGAINLRGKVLPIVDSRIMLNLKVSELTAHSCIMVVDLAFGQELLSLGILVDSVEEVIEIDESQISPAPNIRGLEKANRLVAGMLQKDDFFVLILDVNKLFDYDNLESLASIREQINELTPSGIE